MNHISDSAPQVRIDKWLWAARFFKTRSLAKKAIEGGKVHVDRQRVKVSKVVEIGMILRVQAGWEEREIEILALSAERRGANEAQRLYRETEDSLKRRADHAAARRVTSSGRSDHRPSTRERRQRQAFLADLGDDHAIQSDTDD